MEFRAVILAAGASARMGAQKLLMPFRGRPMIEYALEAAAPWSPLVVAGAEVAAYLRKRSGAAVSINDEPLRGMAHSLAIANTRIAPAAAIIVLLGDKPLVTQRLIAQVCARAEGADVVFPRNPQTHEPGHPVIFSAHARSKIAVLPDGDSLRILRDDPEFARRELPIADRGAYFDVDTASDLDA